MNKLQIISFVCLLIYFSLLLLVVFKERKSKNTEDYFFAGRQLPFWALSITFIASWWGAGSALSTADLAYNDGIGAFWYYGMPVLVSTFLMIIFAKAIRGVGYYTQGKMMLVRYNKKVSFLTSLAILFFMIFSVASQMVGLGDFLGTYLGLKYEDAILLGTVVVLIYSFFGGFRGVVFTDIIQFILLLISAFLVFIVAYQKSGGLAEIKMAANLAGKTNFFSFQAGFHKYIVYVITFGCSWMIQANVWQRISATKNNIEARKMTIMSFLAYIPLYLIVVFTGMAALAIFPQLPEGGVISALVVNYMPSFLGAFVFLGISAAIMSTMDSLINTGAMTFSLDLLPKNFSEKKRLRFSRWATLGVAALALLIALKIRSILQVCWIASDIITTGVFVPLLGGFLWKRGNSHGALVSMIFGIVYSFYNLLISFDLPLPAFWSEQSAEQVILGLSISFFLYVFVSLFTKPEKEKAEKFLEEKGEN